MSDNKEKKDFIVARENQQPLIVSHEKIKLLVKEFEIKGDDLIYVDKQKVWKKARNVKGLRSLFTRLETGLNDKSSNSDHEIPPEDDELDEILFEKIEEKKPQIQQFVPLPFALTPKLLPETKPETVKFLPPALEPKLKKEEPWIQNIERFSFNNSSMKTWFQYGIILCFFSIIIFYFYPSSENLATNEYLHGKITFNGNAIRNRAIIVMGGGKEVTGFLEPKGTYRVENPPMGKLKIKLIPFPQPANNAPVKIDSVGKPKDRLIIDPFSKYETFDNEIVIDYQGGKQLFDLKLNSN